MEARRSSGHDPARTGAEERKERFGGEIRRVPPGTFRAGRPEGRRDRDEHRAPALAMIVAPLLGLCIWGAIVFLIFA